MIIDGYTFGRISIDGIEYDRDLKIIDRRIFPNWWRKSGHRVEPDDISDILAEKPDIVIIGKGSPGRMMPAPSLPRLLEEQGIQFIALPTAQAVSEFNRLLATGGKIAAGFHLTC